ncbi:MAG TPA: hypothetical protein VGB24_12735 [Longimicrobium sp.]|uniref:hypothetical protein n=1 Tax=Longimicrobium sp. TaxID=2029185 RepID=UPI002EDB1C26
MATDIGGSACGDPLNRNDGWVTSSTPTMLASTESTSRRRSFSPSSGTARSPAYTGFVYWMTVASAMGRFVSVW